MQSAPESVTDLAAVLSRRLNARLDKVRVAADYICQLEQALCTAADAVAAIKPGIPKQLSELNDPELTYIGIASDASGNTAVVWVHGECIDTLVTESHGFGDIVSFYLIGTCPVDPESC